MRTAIALLLVCAQVASAATWKFLVYGDSRGTNNTTFPVNTPILSEIAAQTVAENPAFVLFAGDLANSGSLNFYTSWTNTMRSVYAAGIGVAAVAGNHESADFPNFKNIFITPFITAPFAGMTNMVVDNSSFDGRSYSFEFKNAMFLCMDNYSNSSTSAHCVNQTFLDARLAARNPTATPLVFAMWHEPAFKAGQDTGLENKSAQRNAIWTSLQNAGCREVFVGHDHAYAAARLDDGDGNASNDTFQVVAGTAGAPLYSVAYSGDTGSWTVMQLSSESQYGYLRVIVDDVAQTVSQTWVHRTGANTYVDTASTVNYAYGATWTGNGNWSTAGNWNTGALPFNGAAVTFGNAGATCVVDSVSRTIDTITFNRSGNFVVTNSGGAGLTLNRGINVVSNFTYTIVAPVTLARPNTWSVAGALQVTGNLTGSSPLTKTGPGTLMLSAAGSFTGTTIISNGWLSASGSIGGPVTITAGSTLAPIDSLTINSNLTIAGNVNFDLGTSSDQIAVAGNLQLSGTLNITDSGGFGAGPYTLFTYNKTLSNNGLSIGAKPDPNLVYQIDTNVSGQVRLVVLTQFGAWQTEHFGSTTNAAAAADADPDGDGLSNLDEFRAGTAPNDSASALRITGISVEGDNVRIHWATNGGHTNQVEYLLTDSDYQNTNQLWGAVAPAVIVPGNVDVITNVVDFGGATNNPTRYYRVRLLP